MTTVINLGILDVNNNVNYIYNINHPFMDCYPIHLLQKYTQITMSNTSEHRQRSAQLRQNFRVPLQVFIKNLNEHHHSNVSQLLC